MPIINTLRFLRPIAAAATDTFSNITPTTRTSQPTLGDNCFVTAGLPTVELQFFGSIVANNPSRISVHGWEKDASGDWYPTPLGIAEITLGRQAGISGHRPSDSEYWADSICVLGGGGRARQTLDGSPATWFLSTGLRPIVSISVDKRGSTTIGWISRLSRVSVSEG